MKGKRAEGIFGGKLELKSQLISPDKGVVMIKSILVRSLWTKKLFSLRPCCAVGINIEEWSLIDGWITPQFLSTIRLCISNVFTCLFRGGKTQKMTSLGILSAYHSLFLS